MSEFSSANSSDKLSVPQPGSHVTTGGLSIEHVEEIPRFQFGSLDQFDWFKVFIVGFITGSLELRIESLRLFFQSQLRWLSRRPVSRSHRFSGDLYANVMLTRGTNISSSAPRSVTLTTARIRTSIDDPTRTRHAAVPQLFFFKKKNEPLTFKWKHHQGHEASWEAPRKMLERGSKSYLRSGWLAFCVCAAWSLPLCCWAFGRLWCLVLCLALSVWALPLALCFFFS